MKELRHYSATQLLTAGTDLNTVAGRLGHAEGSTTLRFYANSPGPPTGTPPRSSPPSSTASEKENGSATCTARHRPVMTSATWPAPSGLAPGSTSKQR